jgi:hypothetical protein
MLSQVSIIEIWQPLGEAAEYRGLAHARLAQQHQRPSPGCHCRRNQRPGCEIVGAAGNRCRGIQEAVNV